MNLEIMTISSYSSSSSSLPLGYEFMPTDEELLKNYLERKVNNKYLPSDAIIVEDVYAKEPWLLMNCDQDSCMGMSTNRERYFFVKREPLSTKNENGKRVKRDLKAKHGSGGGGWWHASTGDVAVKDDNNAVVGYKKMLKFHCYNNINNNNKRERNDANHTNWIMHEYRLPSDTFQEWVLCRIKLKPCQRKTTPKITDGDDEFQTYLMNILCEDEEL